MGFSVNNYRWFRSLLLVAIFGGVSIFFWTVGVKVATWLGSGIAEQSDPEEEYGHEDFFDEYMRFENGIYDYIDDQAYMMLNLIAHSDKNTDYFRQREEELEKGAWERFFHEIPEEKKKEFGERVLTKIDLFIAEKKPFFSASLYQRVRKLKFNIAVRILSDQKLSEKIIDNMNYSIEKINVLRRYAEAFTMADKKRVRQFLLDQKNWVEEIDPNFFKQLDLFLFYAAPIGQKLPDHFKDLDGVLGEKLSFDNFSGKYLLIDFWASWCLPCLEEIPYLKEMHNTFSPKYFEIIAVSLDSDRKSFNELIERYQLKWPHYFDGKSFSSDLVKKYGVRKLPTKYLIDTERKVILADVSAKEILQWLKEDLSTKIGEEFRRKQGAFLKNSAENVVKKSLK